MLQTANSSQGDNAVETEFLFAGSKVCNYIIHYWDDVTAIIGLFFVIRWLVLK